MTTQIPLYRGGRIVAYTTVDTDDFDVLNRHRWHLNHGGYACRTILTNGRRTTLRMQRAILDIAIGDPRHCDHINRDRLDNRRANLRIVNAGQNCANGARGHLVGVTKKRSKWEGRVMIAGVRHRLGVFASVDDAVAAVQSFREQHGVAI